MSRKTRGNIGVNAILNTIRSCMAVLFPLITYPYAARVLGVENLGKVNYGYSIMTYFSLLAALGVSTYAVRSGSQIRNDKPRLTAFSNQVFTINLYATVLAYALMTAAVSFVPKFRPYRAIILIEGIGFICTTFNVDWVNTIFEDYFIVTVRTLITYAIGLVLLFVFVLSSGFFSQ